MSASCLPQNNYFHQHVANSKNSAV